MEVFVQSLLIIGWTLALLGRTRIVLNEDGLSSPPSATFLLFIGFLCLLEVYMFWKRTEGGMKL